MKAFIQRTFLKENINKPIIHLYRKSLFNYSQSFYTDNANNKCCFSFNRDKNNQSLEKSRSIRNFQNNIIKYSKKSFSRNSTQWLNRHTNDIYVKKSVEVIIISYNKN